MKNPTCEQSEIMEISTQTKECGQGSRECRVCGNTHGMIRKYGLNCCRQCFRDNAEKIGFTKVR